MRNSFGVGIIEVLVTMAVMLTLAGIAIPNYLGAKNTARNSAAMQYANNVYKAAYAYIVSGEHTLIAGDCAGGYQAGQYSTQDPGTGVVASCTVVDNGTNFPAVTVVSAGGTTYRVP